AGGAAQELQPDIDTASSEATEQQPAESESQAGQAEKTAPDEAAAKKNNQRYPVCHYTQLYLLF
ncbi:hypothetical protein, partial [uncultured Campylobacter sp.]|uniref:hypothetical protein n=1 Tax=uncultured Campylobacter sp. TaxID=218934 RepID=UPI0026296A8C